MSYLLPKGRDKFGRSICRTAFECEQYGSGRVCWFAKNLEINGVGYRAAMQGTKLQLS